MQINPSGNGNSPASTLSGLANPSSPTQGERVFRDILAETNSRQHQADTQVRQSLLGKTDLHEAMLALENADLSLRLVVQVRNKLVQAYEELSRMAI
jgi:flagellar hook-basal body complex protein FliE